MIHIVNFQIEKWLNYDEIKKFIEIASDYEKIDALHTTLYFLNHTLEDGAYAWREYEFTKDYLLPLIKNNPKNIYIYGDGGQGQLIQCIKTKKGLYDEIELAENFIKLVYPKTLETGTKESQAFLNENQLTETKLKYRLSDCQELMDKARAALK